ncbi:Luciferin 4-monooxygenase [Eumeta japonica]|uniref:Luciferin 4-monooxygenase n=1 Tax=Eumeta variegata TaxID=151549 RepID=A0A4C1UD68_EUMVA|nr:Luciferin 4-monooxygenase [Eumeta japonica]
MAVSIHGNIVSGPREVDIPAHLSFGQFLFDQLKEGGDNIAQICGQTGEKVTYRDILQKSVNLAVALQRLGLKKGDVVSLASENRFEFTVASLAVMYAGGVLSTLNITYTPGEVVHVLSITKPKFIFASPLAAPNIEDVMPQFPYVEKLILFGPVQIVPGILYEDLIRQNVNINDFTLVDVNGAEDTLGIMCSSGTTGLPKGVMLTHVNFLLLTAHLKYYLDTSMSKRKHSVKVMLSVIPWFHAYGFITHLAILSGHIETVFLVGFQEELFLQTIQNYKVNLLFLVPPLAVFLAKHPLVAKYNLSSLNEVWCGAAPLSSDIQKLVSQRIGLDFIRQGFGFTEMTMACFVDMNGRKPGTCGTPGPGLKVKVVDIDSGKTLGPRKEGELWFKSPLRMKGYMGDPAAGEALFDSAGFIRSGDIGYYDEDGDFYIVDRLKELIKYKGFQVAPAELEALLLKHSGVAECGVVGVPDEAAGELPLAFVVVQPGAKLTEQELQEYVAKQVSPAKHLRGGVIFIKEIPKNPSGKILRRELRQMLKKPKSKL